MTGLLRAVLVCPKQVNHRSYLITAAHHAIADGLCCLRLHSELLTYCQRIAAGEAIATVTCLPPLPPLTNLLPNSMQGCRGAMSSLFFLLRLRSQLLWKRPKALAFEPVPLELRHSDFIHKRLSEALTQQLINRCRQEKTTIQGALGAAMLLVAGNQIAASKRAQLSVSCQSVVDLRRRLQPVVSDEPMGVLVSQVTSFHSLPAQPCFWEVAREVQHQLEARLASNDHFNIFRSYAVELKME